MTGEIIFGIAAANAVVIGVLALRRSTTNSATATFNAIISHTVGCFALFLGMYFLVPKYRQVYEAFQVELPGIAILLIRASDTVVRSSLALGVLLVLFLAADAVLFFVRHQNSSTRTCAKIGSGCITGLIAVASLLSAIPIGLPAIQLWNQMS